MDLSVVIPVYNAEKTIIESLESVINELKNTNYEWEIILINDGSTDSSSDIINQYLSNSFYKDKIIFVSQTNSGVSAARNVGIQLAKGDYIAFNDSDDKWLSGKVELQMEYIRKKTNIDVIAGVYGDDNPYKIKKRRYETRIKIQDQIFKNYFSPPTILCKSSIFKTIGLFPSDLRYMEDAFLFNKASFFCNCVLLDVKLASCVVNKGRWGDVGLSSNVWEMGKSELKNISFAYKNNYISVFIYILAYTFSIFKMCRRIMFFLLRKL